MVILLADLCVNLFITRSHASTLRVYTLGHHCIIAGVKRADEYYKLAKCSSQENKFSTVLVLDVFNFLLSFSRNKLYSVPYFLNDYYKFHFVVLSTCFYFGLRFLRVGCQKISHKFGT